MFHSLFFSILSKNLFSGISDIHQFMQVPQLTLQHHSDMQSCLRWYMSVCSPEWIVYIVVQWLLKNINLWRGPSINSNVLSTHVATPRVFVYPSFSSFCNISDKPKELSGKPPRLLILPNHNLPRLLMTKQSLLFWRHTQRLKFPLHRASILKSATCSDSGKKKVSTSQFSFWFWRYSQMAIKNAIVYFP